MKRMAIYSSVGAILVAVAILFIFCFNARIPESHSWKGYFVVYVDRTIPESEVLTTFSDYGVKKIITLSGQRQPFVSDYVPVQSLDSDEYLTDRQRYFFDQSQKMQLYYIADEDLVAGLQVTSVLHDRYGSTAAGIDHVTEYPWFVPVAVVIVFLILFIISKSKLYFFAASLYPVLFSFCLPQYTSAMACILAMYVFFLANSFLRRKKILWATIKNPVIVIFALLSFVSAFIGSVEAGLLFILVYIGSFSLLFLLRFKNKKKSQQRFVPILIRPAEMVPVFSKKSFFTIFLPAIVSVFFCGILIFSGHFPIDNTINGLFIPAPTEYTEEASFTREGYEESVSSKGKNSLPNLAHYVHWVWKTMTFPYRSLYDENTDSQVAQFGDEVCQFSYAITESGTIQESVQTLYTFDDSFMQLSLEMIDANALQIEQLLKDQQCFTAVGFKQTGSRNSNISSTGQLSILLALSGVIMMSMIAGILIWRKIQ
ncbi:MAG: hypothetical protein MR839_05500 [Spirochaetia bacterium]|nr:hypothetical protein [Spirochaetia bacterium]